MPEAANPILGPAIFTPLSYLRNTPRIKNLSCEAQIWNFTKSQILSRIIILFTIIFGTAEGLVHLIKATWSTGRRCVCLANAFNSFKIGVIGSFIGVFWPGVLDKHLTFKKPVEKSHSNPISKALATHDNPCSGGEVNGIYITANETGLEGTRKFLEGHPRHGDSQTIHIGCAGWHNFDIMCERGSSYGLIVDFNPENAKFIEKTIESIKSSSDKKMFLENMIKYLLTLKEEKRKAYFHWDLQGKSLIDRVTAELVREGSWLNTDKAYKHIKKLVSEDRLIAITEDITHSEKFSSIRKVLNENNIVIDTLYLSNICNFMRSETRESAIVKSIKHVLNDDTVFISCPKRKDGTNGPHQKAMLGREVLEETFNTNTLFQDSA